MYTRPLSSLLLVTTVIRSHTDASGLSGQTTPAAARVTVCKSRSSQRLRADGTTSEKLSARAAANPESCWCQCFLANTDITNKNARRIVFLCLQGVQFNTKTPHHAVEKYLKALKAPLTYLRPNFFMQNLPATYRNDIRDHGQTVVPAARARTAFVDTEYVGRLESSGATADYIEVQKMIYRVVRTNVSALSNETIRRLTGQAATTFAHFAQRARHTWARGTGSAEAIRADGCADGCVHQSLLN